MLESALGPQVTKVFQTIQKSGILTRFGANKNATQNFEALIELFAKKAHDAGWDNKEKQEVTTIIVEEREAKTI